MREKFCYGRVRKCFHPGLGDLKLGSFPETGLRDTSGSNPRRRKARKEKFSLGRLRGLRTQSKERKKTTRKNSGAAAIFVVPPFLRFSTFISIQFGLEDLLKRLKLSAKVTSDRIVTGSYSDRSWSFLEKVFSFLQGPPVLALGAAERRKRRDPWPGGGSRKKNGNLFLCVCIKW